MTAVVGVRPPNAMGLLLGNDMDGAGDTDAESLRAEVLSLRARLESERALNQELSIQIRRSSRSSSLSQVANGIVPPPVQPAASVTNGAFPHSTSVRPPFGTSVPSVGTPRYSNGGLGLASPTRGSRPRSALDHHSPTEGSFHHVARRKASLGTLPTLHSESPPMPSTSQFVLSPISPDVTGRFLRRASHTSSSPGGSSVDRGQSRIPVSAVATARALAGGAARTSLGSPKLDGSQGATELPPESLVPSSSTMRASLSSSSSSAALAPSAIPRPIPSPSFQSSFASSSSSPFFGGSSSGEKHANRVASAQSGTGKVVSQLQIDLSTTRSALEQTKTQLRVSQRAVEALGRQVDEHREARERLRVDAEASASRLSRRERQLEEVLARAQRAEAELGRAQAAERDAVKHAKSLEAGAADARQRCAKAESERDALASGIAESRAGWRRELDAAHDSMAKLGATFRAELEQQAVKHDAALQARKSAAAEVSAALAARHALQERQLEAIDALTADVRRSLASSDDSRQRTDDVAGELRRLRRLMRDRTGAAAD